MSTTQTKTDAKSITALILTVAALVFTIFPVTVRIKSQRISLNYAVVPAIIVLFLTITTIINWETVVRGMLGPASPDKYRDETSSSNLIPLTVIALFFGLAYACISAEQSRLFQIIAGKFKQMALKSKNRRVIGMLLFYILAGVFTLCTSNDIVILCLTPMILEFIQQIDDETALLPMLINQFAAANTFSACLLSGNPSNFILTSVFGINFIAYLVPMIIPGISAGIVVFVYTFVILKIRAQKVPESQQKSTPKVNDDDSLLVGDVAVYPKVAAAVEQVAPRNQAPINNFNVVFSAVLLITMFFAFMFSSLIQSAIPKFDLCYISVTVGSIQLIKDLVLLSKKQVDFKSILSKLPWGVCPFLLAMFILVEQCISSDLISDIASMIARWVQNCGGFGFGALSGALTVLCCICFNNLPGTIIISRILNDNALKTHPAIQSAAFNAAAASNYGALFLPHCSLAGLMWSQLVNRPKEMKRIWFNGSCIGVLCYIASVLVISVTWSW